MLPAPSQREAGSAPWRDSVLVGLATFLLLRLLAQDTFYGPDGRVIIKMTMSGLVAHPLHLLYVPMLRVSHAVVSLWGGSWYDAGLLLSQVGSALGALAWHRASAGLGLARGAAVAVVALSVTAPATLFFGSVIELHAPFLAFAGLACCAAVRLAQRGTAGAALALGAVTGIAVGAHATGHLLLLWLPALAYVEARDPDRRRWLRLLACVVLAHVVATLGLTATMRACGAPVEAGAAARFLAEEGASVRLAWLPMQAWMDWLRPFAPLSFVVWLGLFHQRGLGAVFAVGWLAYLGATFLLMAPTTENGAYVLPMVWPAALLVVRTLPRFVWLLTAVAGLALGVRWIVAHDAPEFGRAFVADVRAVAAGAPVDLLLGQHREFDACLIFGPDLAWKELINEASLPPETVPALVAGLQQWVLAQERAGRSVLLAEGVLQYLQAPFGPEQRTGPLLRAGIERAFILEPVHRTTLRAWRLRVR